MLKQFRTVCSLALFLVLTSFKRRCVFLFKVVSSLPAAVDHIHKYGSSHTECIVAEDPTQAKLFMDSVGRIFFF
jgi:gamma-glutamyl phosphate reductase